MQLNIVCSFLLYAQLFLFVLLLSLFFLNWFASLSRDSLTLIALMQTRWQKSAVNPFNGTLN